MDSRLARGTFAVVSALILLMASGCSSVASSPSASLAASPTVHLPSSPPPSTDASPSSGEPTSASEPSTVPEPSASSPSPESEPEAPEDPVTFANAASFCAHTGMEAQYAAAAGAAPLPYATPNASLERKAMCSWSLPGTDSWATVMVDWSGASYCPAGTETSLYAPQGATVRSQSWKACPDGQTLVYAYEYSDRPELLLSKQTMEQIFAAAMADAVAVRLSLQ